MKNKSLNEAIWRVTQSSLTRNGMNRTKTFRVEGKTKKDAWKEGRHKHLMKHGLPHIATLHLHKIEKVNEEKKPYKSLAHAINEVILGLGVKAVLHGADVLPKIKKKIDHGAYLSNRKHPGKHDDFKFSHPITPHVLEEGRSNQKTALSKNRHSVGAKRHKLNKAVKPSFKVKKNRKTGSISFVEDRDIGSIVNKYVNEARVDVRLKGRQIYMPEKPSHGVIRMHNGTVRHPIRVSSDIHKKNPEFPTHLDDHTKNQLEKMGYQIKRKLEEVVRSDQRTEVPVTKYDPKDKRMEITKRNRRRKEIKLGPERQGNAYGYEPYVNPATGDVGPSS